MSGSYVYRGAVITDDDRCYEVYEDIDTQETVYVEVIMIGEID